MFLDFHYVECPHSFSPTRRKKKIVNNRMAFECACGHGHMSLCRKTIRSEQSLDFPLEAVVFIVFTLMEAIKLADTYHSTLLIQRRLRTGEKSTIVNGLLVYCLCNVMFTCISYCFSWWLFDLNRGRMNCNTFNSIYAVVAAFTHTHIAYPMQFMLAKITFHLHSAATINIHRKSSLLCYFLRRYITRILA